MKTKICIIIVATILIGACPAQADTVWLSGHHEVVDGNVYGEIVMYNDATATMSGGYVYYLDTFDITTFNMLEGQIDILDAHGDSTINIRGGSLDTLGVTENGSVYLYAYDVIYHPTGGHFGRGWVEGNYFANDLYFNFDLIHTDTFSHITVVPEPVDAEIDIKPDTLNISSKGKWISCKIWLPEEYDVADVNSSSVFLEDELAPDWIWFNKNQNVVMAKFSRSALREILADLETPSEVELTVSGELIDGTTFEGSDTIKVIDKGRSRRRRVNSNSKVVDGIEYYIQTDKAVYNLGENVEILYRVTNLRDEDVTFAFGGSPEWNFWVEKHRENIWRAVNGWWWIGSGFTLAPSEYKEYPYEWDMRDDENNLVSVGRYDVIGGFDGGASLYGSDEYDFTKVSVGIKIVPEPKGRVKHN